jgi:hypothetical protein
VFLIVSSACWFVAFYAADDLVLKLLSTSLDAAISSTVVILEMIASFALAFWMHDAITKVLPAVEFAGRLADELSRYRARVSVLFGVLIIPIVVRVAYDLLKGVLGR